MYRGEGDESELASLSAPVVMSLSKASLKFNGAQLQGKREKRRAQNLCTNTHTHTHTHTDTDNAAHYRLEHTSTSAQSPHAKTENTHTCTLVLRRKQGSRRVNGVEAQGPWDWKPHSAWSRGKREKTEGENKRGRTKNWGAMAYRWENVLKWGENAVEAGIESSADDVLTLSEAMFTRQLGRSHASGEKKEQGCSGCGEKTTVWWSRG